MKFLVTDTVDGPDSSSKCNRVRMNSGSNNGRGGTPGKEKIEMINHMILEAPIVVGQRTLASFLGDASSIHFI